MSPVNESDTDFNFNELAEIPEAKDGSVVAANVLENIDENENISEAETVIADDLPRLDEGKKLLREQTADVKRHKLKKTKLNTILVPMKRRRRFKNQISNSKNQKTTRR